MNPKLLIALTALFFSCHSGKVKEQPVATVVSSADTVKQPGDQPVNMPADTASADYLIYLLKNELPLNDHWTQKLEKLGEFSLPTDSTTHLSITRDWLINDSVSAIILRRSTGTGFDEYLLTIKHKKEFVSKLHIDNNTDADPGDEYPDYDFTEYKLVNDRNVKLFKHTIKDYDRKTEKDIVKVQNWLINDNGGIILE